MSNFRATHSNLILGKRAKVVVVTKDLKNYLLSLAITHLTVCIHTFDPLCIIVHSTNKPTHKANCSTDAGQRHAPGVKARPMWR